MHPSSRTRAPKASGSVTEHADAPSVRGGVGTLRPVSNEPRGPNWWQAADGKWYPPAPPNYGAPVGPSGPSGPPGAPVGPPGAPQGYPIPPAPRFEAASGPPPGTNGLATAALVLGITGVCCGVTGILAIIFGAIAINQTGKTGQNGRGLAIAGLVLGIVTVLGTGTLFFIGRANRTSTSSDVVVFETYPPFTNEFRTIPPVTFEAVPDPDQAPPSFDPAVTSFRTIPAATVGPAPLDASFVYGTGTCAAADGSSAKQQRFGDAPQLCVDPTRQYTATVETNLGTYTAVLRSDLAPGTVNNFVNLARFHYFDDTVCHRAIPGFMVQCGDPTGTGTGDPGYSFTDELPAPGSYRIGSLAMANAGPDTNGSQFFLITGDEGVALPPNYTLFGEVTSGLETVTVLDAAGNSDPASNGVPPTQEIRILRITITES